MDRAVEKWWAACKAGNSQQSNACAMVAINKALMHREAHEPNNFRESADRLWLLFISREIR